MTERRLFPPRNNDEEPQLLYTKSAEANLDGGIENAGYDRVGLQQVNENVPLKPIESKKRRRLCRMEFGFAMINLSFFVVTLVVTIALVVEIYYGDPIRFPAAVVSDNEDCSKLGLEVLKRQGSSVDAMITINLCLSVVHPHVIGIGGGGFILIRESTKKTVVLDFREISPSSIPNDLNPSQVVNRPAVFSVGVPGFLNGLYRAHELYGKLPWSDLVTSVSNLARRGFNISPYLAEALKQKTIQSPSVLSMFNMSRAGQWMKRENFARTLDMIAQYGADVFYHGMLAETTVAEIRNRGGFLSLEDFNKYQTVITEPLEIQWNGLSISSPPPPSSGAGLLSALRVLENVTLIQNTSVISILKAIKVAAEVMKDIGVSYAKENNNSTKDFYSLLNRIHELISASTQSSELRVSKGSSVVASDGQELFATSVCGLGSWFGSQIVTADGIVLNDALKDLPSFSLPNFFQLIPSEKRPMSSLTPVSIYETTKPCGLRLAASSANYQLLLQVLLQRLSINQSLPVEDIRFDVSTGNKTVFIEQGYNGLESNLTMKLTTAGYVVTPVNPPFISINMLSKEGDDIIGQADFRGGGSMAEI